MQTTEDAPRVVLPRRVGLDETGVLAGVLETGAEAPEGRRARAPEIDAQRLLRPDPRINADPRLFVHAGRWSGYDVGRGVYFALPGARLRFDTWFNAFQLSALDLDAQDRVALRLHASGDFVLRVISSREDAADEVLFSGRIRAVAGRPAVVELGAPRPGGEGVLHMRLDAVEETELRDASWLIRGPRQAPVRIEAVITTFKRDAAVQSSCARLQSYMDANPDLSPHFRLTVVDNGGDTRRIPFRGGRVLRNRNLGGAGGFTRGLLEARADGAVTHVLFMDDDAEFFPENLRRTIAILKKARAPNAAVAGAMLSAGRRWRMWENTAVFDKLCRPLDKDLDLRRFDEVLLSARDKRRIPNRYAGWWYFCFPLRAARRLPFPFFVRGDDVFFSLANDFDIRTMTGLCSHQDDFVAKRSPLNAYLDARYHLVQMLTQSCLDSDEATLRDQLQFLFNQWNHSYHYGSAEAVLMAIEDVMKGPAFWDEDPEMSRGRARIKEIAGDETVRDGLDYDPGATTPVAPDKHTSPFFQRLRWLTANGHRAPGWMFYSRAARFPFTDRFAPNQVFLRREAVVVDEETGQGYRLRFDRARFFANRRRFRRDWRALRKALPALREAYAEAGRELASEAAWRARLGL